MHKPAFVVDFSSYKYAYGEPQCSSVIKSACADFCVVENLGFEPDNIANHLWIKLRKTDLTTTDVARRISNAFSLRLNEVGYSGMKDKRGVCSQWFSIPRAGLNDADLHALDGDALTVLDVRRNSRKLKIGSHRSNDFTIVLRDFNGAVAELEQRLQQAARYGVPNYYGPQRFGQDGQNVVRALDYFAISAPSGSRRGGAKRRLLLSALRSFVFNEVLSQRVQQGTWNKILPGEVLNLDGTNRFFNMATDSLETADCDDSGGIESLRQRAERMDVHPTGILCGRLTPGGKYMPSADVEILEREVLQQFSEISAVLVDKSITVSRRPLRLVPRKAGFRVLQPHVVELQFTLARGGYATAVLRELCRVKTMNPDDQSARTSK